MTKKSNWMRYWTVLALIVTVASKMMARDLTLDEVKAEVMRRVAANTALRWFA